MEDPEVRVESRRYSNHNGMAREGFAGRGGGVEGRGL